MNQNHRSAIAAVVVNWKQEQLTRRCLNSLQASDIPLQVFIVDNGSEDGSAESLAEQFPDATLLSLSSNMGFGFACNGAIEKILVQTECQYILIVNNDAEIEPDAVFRLFEEARKNPEAGLWSPKILLQEKPDTLWYAGCRKTGWLELPCSAGRGQKDQGQFDSFSRVDYLFGAALFVHRTVFETIGKFDERFFLYMEDLDYSLRASRAGFSPGFVPEARVYHRGSASTGGKPDLKYFHLGRSLVLYLGKHIPQRKLFPVFLAWVVRGAGRLAPDLIRGKFSIIPGTVKGICAGLRFHSENFSKREFANTPRQTKLGGPLDSTVNS